SIACDGTAHTVRRSPPSIEEPMKILSRIALCSSLTVLAVATAPASFAAAQAQATSWQGGVKLHFMSTNSNSWQYIIHPTFAACANALTALIASYNPYAPQITVIDTQNCHPIGGPPPREVNPPPMYPERLAAGQQAEIELRERYRIDEFDAELRAIWKLDDEEGDGGEH
ncbi:MAG: hypothetical protein ABI411_19170, partial [Tahibacter sp.]